MVYKDPERQREAIRQSTWRYRQWLLRRMLREIAEEYPEVLDIKDEEQHKLIALDAAHGS